MRILIVDDDYVSRSKLKAMLSAYGDCDAVPNGSLAMDMVKIAQEEAVPYDLITMDVDMPGERGQEVVEKIRKWEESTNLSANPSDIKILMVTVMSQPREIMTSFRKGCEGYLVKPVTPQSLKESLAKIGFTL